MKLSNILLTIASLLFVGCNSTPQKVTNAGSQPAIAKLDTLHMNKPILKETFQQADTVYNQYLAERLKPIRQNFNRINSIVKWTLTDTMELQESTEGGEATFYYSSGVLEKIVTRHFGETFQQLTEYYLLNEELSFVFEKSFKYNRPIYYDSTALKENKDNQTFDFKKSEIMEDRSYFYSGKLIHQVNNEDCGSPMADNYLMGEQQRLTTYFDKLIKMAKQM